MNLQQLIDKAKIEGSYAGTDAASWYFDEGRSNVTREDYQRVLTGLADGDPAILDTLPNSPLSGEFADSTTPHTLYDELGVTETQLRNWESSGELDQICTAYEDAFVAAVQETIEQHCHTMLEQDVIFHISIKTEQNPGQLLSKLVDLLAKENCDIDEEEFEVV